MHKYGISSAAASALPDTREPIYIIEGIRVVSCANARWQAQRYWGDGTKTLDPWRPIARPTDFRTAKMQAERSR